MYMRRTATNMHRTYYCAKTHSTRQCRLLNMFYLIKSFLFWVSASVRSTCKARASCANFQHRTCDNDDMRHRVNCEQHTTRHIYSCPIIVLNDKRYNKPFVCLGMCFLFVPLSFVVANECRSSFNPIIMHTMYFIMITVIMLVII